MHYSPTRSLYARLISIPIWVYAVSMLAFAGALIIVVAPSAKLVQQAHAAQQSVSMANMAFSPATITIAAGDTVVWTNNSSLQHTVTADDGSFDSGTINEGGTYSHTFMTPGTYHYYCRFHGAPGGVGMSGTVIVTGSGQSNSNPPQNTSMNNTQPMQSSNSMPMQMNMSPQPSYQPAQQSLYSPSTSSYNTNTQSNNSDYPSTSRSQYQTSHYRHSCHYVSYYSPNMNSYSYSYPYRSYGSSYGGYAMPYQMMYAQPYSYSNPYTYPMGSYGYSYSYPIQSQVW